MVPGMLPSQLGVCPQHLVNQQKGIAMALTARASEVSASFRLLTDAVEGSDTSVQTCIQHMSSS